MAKVSVWAVTMVRDELDVLPYTLAHLANEGVEGIVVADNLSEDGTREWLQEADLPCELEVLSDDEVGYYQSRKMTRLAHRAFQRGAQWVIPFDADELWLNSATATSLRDSLAKVPAGVDALNVSLHNYFPTSDDAPDPNPFIRIVHRDPVAAELTKVIVRRNPQVVIEQGNHSVSGLDPLTCIETPIEVAHFPWRSPEQFLRKVRNGARAYRATDLPEHIGAHWRAYGDMLDNYGESAVIATYRDWFLDPDSSVERRPVPWLRSYKH